MLEEVQLEDEVTRVQGRNRNKRAWFSGDQSRDQQQMMTPRRIMEEMHVAAFVELMLLRSTTIVQ